MSSFIPQQMAFGDISEEYQTFIDKFKPKKTTDDCYTPDEIYDVVLDWVVAEYGIDRGNVVRPFYPGGDYERADYPQGCTVVDNPPFSILSQIVHFYTANSVPFFLFAPGMTTFNAKACAVCTMCNITYENGAEVRTSFLTSLEPGTACRTAPELTRAVNEKNNELLKAGKKQVAKYEFPDHVVTASKMGWLSIHGEPFKVARGESAFIRTLDAMDVAGKSGIFGGGYLLSERAAAERAAAERAAAERWQLSDRELRIVSMLGGGAS